ncbi:unnamed protein product [Calypogeia fissa]
MLFRVLNFTSKSAQYSVSFTLERPKLKHVIHDPESSENRLVLLDEGTDGSDLLEEKLTEIRKSLPIDVVPYEVDLDYRYFSVEQVLRDILPEGWKVPASFETVGHIAHLNLTDELLPYRKIIAEVFLDKNQPKIRTIVNKVGTISNEFRVPTWEVLAGDTNLVTEVKQHNAVFRLDFGLVYWNSRLEFEHKRLCADFQPGQVILDMFAGIGPFAVPAAQQGCAVFANDLNPASVQYLKVNSKINKVEGNIKAYNLDAREFMRNLQSEVAKTTENIKDDGFDGSIGEKSNLAQVNAETLLTEDTGATSIGDGEQKVKQGMVKRKSGSAKGQNATSKAMSEAKPWELFHHVVMNLPASALEFLDVFNGLLSRDTWKGPMPRVHCYCFMRASETTEDVVKRAEAILGGNITDPQVWTVRDVAPNKIMLCISFDLPEQVAFRETELGKQLTTAEPDNLESGLEPSTQFTQVQSKRPRTES